MGACERLVRDELAVELAVIHDGHRLCCLPPRTAPRRSWPCCATMQTYSAHTRRPLDTHRCASFVQLTCPLAQLVSQSSRASAPLLPLSRTTSSESLKMTLETSLAKALQNPLLHTLLLLPVLQTSLPRIPLSPHRHSTIPLRGLKTSTSSSMPISLTRPSARCPARPSGYTYSISLRLQTI